MNIRRSSSLQNGVIESMNRPQKEGMSLTQFTSDADDKKPGVCPTKT